MNKRIRFLSHAVVALLLLAVAGCSACRKTTAPANANRGQVLTTPPFTAAEPNQYRATRVTTYTNTDQPPQQTGLARDGSRTRMDLTVDGQAVLLLETPDGRVLIANDRAVFARLQPDEPVPMPSPDEAPLAPDLAPERLLNQDDRHTEYKKLRPDNFNGRAVTVYQATIRTGDDQTDSILWIDDETGFPLKTEVSEFVGGVLQPTGYLSEIRDLVLGPPPPGWFEIPVNYREIAVSEFWARKSEK